MYSSKERRQISRHSPAGSVSASSSRVSISVDNVMRPGIVTTLGKAAATTQRLILLGLILGYTGIYFCRTNIVVSINMILRSLPGIDKAEFGTILSLGYVFYASGKLFQGALMDAYGGRPVFLAGLIGSIVCTFLLANIDIGYDLSVDTSDIVVRDSGYVMMSFLFLNCLNRLFQSGTWGAIVYVISKTYLPSMHGMALGIASISYGFGDVIVRLVLGGTLQLVSHGQNSREMSPEKAGGVWRVVFYIAVVCAGVLTIPTAWILLSTRSFSVNSPPSVTDKAEGGLQQTLRRILKQPKFWLLLVLSFCLTFLRETIMIWSAMYMVDVVGMTDGDAAMATLLFPLFGTVSTVLGGWIMDNATISSRGRILVSFLVGLVTILGIAASFPDYKPTVSETVMAIIMISLFLLAPFSFVDGILSLTLAGSHGAGITLGLINAAGYTGAILAGHQIGAVVDSSGWGSVIRYLWIVSLLALLTAMVYWRVDKR